jgi:hypothetical protein
MGNRVSNLGVNSGIGGSSRPLPFYPRELVIAAGATMRFPGVWKWFTLLSTTDDTLGTLKVQHYPGQEYSDFLKGLLVEFDEPTSGLSFKNASGSSITIVVAVGGDSTLRDNRLVVNEGTDLEVTIAGPNPLPVSIPGLANPLPVSIPGLANPLPVSIDSDDNIAPIGLAGDDGSSPGALPITLVAAGANVNGLIVRTGFLLGDTGGSCRLTAGGVVIFEGNGNIGIALPYPLRVPAGVALKVESDSGPADVRWSFTWDVL